MSIVKIATWEHWFAQSQSHQQNPQGGTTEESDALLCLPHPKNSILRYLISHYEARSSAALIHNAPAYNNPSLGYVMGRKW